MFKKNNLSVFKMPLFIGAFFLINACSFSLQKISSKPVVQVNQHALTTKEFSLLLSRRLKSLDAISVKDPNNIRLAKDEVINNFIVQSLIQDWASSKSIVISEKALDSEVDKIRSNYPDDLSFRKSLATEGISFSEWRESLRQTLLERQVFSALNAGATQPTTEEINTYYNENKELFKRKESLLIRQIVLADEARAEIVKNELKKTKFEELAKKYSIAPEAKNGGLIGWIEKGVLEYVDPLFTSPIGIYPKVIKSQYGFHIIMIEKKAPASYASVDENKNIIKNQLMAKKEQALFKAWLDKQIRSSNILKDIELINSIKIETKGPNE